MRSMYCIFLLGFRVEELKFHIESMDSMDAPATERNIFCKETLINYFPRYSVKKSGK